MDGVPELIRRLASDPDESALADLYRALLFHGTVTEAAPGAVPLLVELLDAPGVDRERVLNLLGAIGEGSRAVEDTNLAEATRVALATGLPVYERLVADDDEAVRLATTYVLGGCGVAVPVLRDRMANDDSSTVRACLLLAAEEAGTPFDPREWLSDEAMAVRATAGLLLARAGEIDDDVIAVLEQDLPVSIDDFANVRWVHVNGGGMDVVLKALDSQPDLQLRLLHSWLGHVYPSVRAEASFSASRLLTHRSTVKRTVPLLVDCLTDSDPVVRRWAAWHLGNVGEAARPAADAMWTVAHTEPLQHDEPAALSVRALAALHDPRAAQLLADALAEEPVDWRPLWALLPYIGPWAPQCRQPLMRHLADAPSGETRERAIAVIGSFGPDPEAVRAIQAQLASQPRAASRVLGDFGPAAAAALTDVAPLVEHEDAFVRINAARAVWRISGDPGPVLTVIRAEIAQPGQECVHALKVLAELGPAGAELAASLPPMFTSTGVVLVAWAAIAYWRLTGDTATALPALLSCLQPRPFGLPRDTGIDVLRCLADMGSAAESAVPMLEQELSADRYGDWYDECRRTVARITAEQRA